MSTQGKRDFRPRLHYTPQKGWINDPNGLVYENGTYHLFAQHNPDAPIWGPMHWSHATSKDLVTWQHLPIALSPDEDGFIFSGSAVIDTENRAGFGSSAMIAMYTCHGEQETQAIAYSTDGGVHFTKYPGNPVIPNPGLKDFRDPKLFWNPVKSTWSMVLAATDRVHFYCTQNFVDWEKTGEFGPDGNHASGIWECPDLVPLSYQGKTLWMLIVSMTTSEEDGRINTQYFLGDFDGDTFHCTHPFGQMEKLDDGWDHYAGVTFNQADQAIFIGWGLSHGYGNQTPTGEYCGQMTFARTLALAETAAGPRAASTLLGVDPYFDAPISLQDGDTLDADVFRLRVRGDAPGSVTLRNSAGQALRFGIDEDNHLFVDRSQAGVADFEPSFGKPLYSLRRVPRYQSGAYELDFIWDVSIGELYLDNGTRCFTFVAYPDTSYNQISLSGGVTVTLQPEKSR